MKHVCVGPICSMWEECNDDDAKTKYPEDPRLIVGATANFIQRFAEHMSDFGWFAKHPEEVMDLAEQVAPLVPLLREAVAEMKGSVEVAAMDVLVFASWMIPLIEEGNEREVPDLLERLQAELDPIMVKMSECVKEAIREGSPFEALMAALKSGMGPSEIHQAITVPVQKPLEGL